MITHLRILTLALVMGWASVISAYTGKPVLHGGTIAGRVVLNGPEPQPLAYSLITNNDAEFCGRISTKTGWRLLDEFHIGPDGGLKNAVVFIEDLREGKPFPETPPALITAEDCVFAPWLLVVQNRQPLHIVNMDPIIHDVQVYETAPFGSRVMLHRPLRLNPFHPENLLTDHHHKPGEAMIDVVQLTRGRRIFFVECGFHPFMQAWGLAITNPYYAVTDDRGKFMLADLPEGVYTLVAWHPGMGGFLDMEVVVLAGDTTNVRMEFQDYQDRRSAHTTMSPTYRFGIRALEREGRTIDIQATHEHQRGQVKE